MLKYENSTIKIYIWNIKHYNCRLCKKQQLKRCYDKQLVHITVVLRSKDVFSSLEVFKGYSFWICIWLTSNLSKKLFFSRFLRSILISFQCRDFQFARKKIGKIKYLLFSQNCRNFTPQKLPVIRYDCFIFRRETFHDMLELISLL
jgi:hypothetical protein